MSNQQAATYNGDVNILNSGTPIFGIGTLTVAGNVIVLNNIPTTNSSTGSILSAGGISISNTTDASSSTNGGSMTIGGGIAVGKSAFIGTNLSVGANLTTIGTINCNSNLTTVGTITCNSNLSTVGTITCNSNINLLGSVTSGNWNGNAISISKGGTGQTTKTTAFNALSPLTTNGDLLYYNSGNNQNLPVGSNGQVLTVSSGLPSWSTNSGYIVYNFSDRKPSTINGGSATANIWNTRTLNTTEKYPTSDTRLSLNSNQITFTPGTYFFNISAPAAFGVNSHTCRLYNITNNSVLAYGTSEFCDLTSCSRSIINTVQTFDNNTVVEVQHNVLNSVVNVGFGVASGLQTEVYTTVYVSVLV